MKVHLIGNGPSKKFYVDDGAHAYGCNFASDELNLRATIIHDARVYEHIIRHKVKLKWPVVNKDMHLRKFGTCGGLITIKDTYYPIPGKSTCSSGHMGLLWLASKGYREIHLWGFDSLVADTVESDSKGKIDGSNPNPQLLPSWKERFTEIFTEFKRYGISVIAHRDSVESFRLN